VTVSAVPLRLRYAALPYRMAEDGTVEILLVTTRKVGRWIVPQGKPERRRDAPETAAREAWEEAGLKGEIARWPIGAYGYAKPSAGGRRRIIVQVFPLAVTVQAPGWKEQHERRSSWLPAQVAARRVAYAGLAQLIRVFDGQGAR
jgi:8-oxo-dGTP pyrophosphatase MutT (NUDIX family)